MVCWVLSMCWHSSGKVARCRVGLDCINIGVQKLLLLFSMQKKTRFFGVTVPGLVGESLVV